MKAGIKRFAPANEYYFDEGCFINELSNSADDEDLSIARARVASGQTTRWHRLTGVAERYLILEGRGRVEVADLAPAEVGPGDVVIIPPGEAQRMGGAPSFTQACGGEPSVSHTQHLASSF